MIARRLVILAGAHKTASSHLQHSLLAAEAELKAHGIALVGPKTMRQDLTPFSQLLRDGMTPEVVTAGANGFLDHYGGDADTIVLMDENILGGTDRKMLLRKTRLYPWAPRRIARLLQLFGDHRVDIAFAVRNPATFLPSCWSESLLHGRYSDFRGFLQCFDATGAFWGGLVDRVRAAAPNTELKLWRYEDYGTLGQALFASLLKPQAAEIVKPDEHVRRPGLSAAAAEWFQAQDNLDKDKVQEARKRFPKTGPETAFVPWSASELRALNESYDQDITAIAAIEGVHLLRP